MLATVSDRLELGPDYIPCAVCLCMCVLVCVCEHVNKVTDDAAKAHFYTAFSFILCLRFPTTAPAKPNNNGAICLPLPSPSTLPPSADIPGACPIPVASRTRSRSQRELSMAKASCHIPQSQCLSLSLSPAAPLPHIGTVGMCVMAFLLFYTYFTSFHC